MPATADKDNPCQPSRYLSNNLFSPPNICDFNHRNAKNPSFFIFFCGWTISKFVWDTSMYSKYFALQLSDIRHSMLLQPSPFISRLSLHHGSN
jgi:hypothetical protein